MFNKADQKDIDAHKEKLRYEYEIDKARAAAVVNKDLAALKDQVVALQADLKIEKAKNDAIKDKAKAEYAEHVMAITDERVKEIRGMYEGYAKNLTDVVKAAHPQGIQVIK